MMTCFKNFIFISMLLHETEWGQGVKLMKKVGNSFQGKR